MKPPITIFLLLTLQACVPPDEAARQTCHAAAFAMMDRKAARLCPLDEPWDDCEHAQNIENEFVKMLEECDE